MDEVPDESNETRANKLPDHCNHVLMTEEEFITLHEGGGEKKKDQPETKRPTPLNEQPRMSEKSRDKRSTRDEEHTPLNEQSRPSEESEPRDENKRCYSPQQTAYVHESTRPDGHPPPPEQGEIKFRDRPAPSPKFDWFYDPRMPKEWNLVIRDHDIKGEPPLCHFRQPTRDEIQVASIEVTSAS